MLTSKTRTSLTVVAIAVGVLTTASYISAQNTPDGQRPAMGRRGGPGGPGRFGGPGGPGGGAPLAPMFLGRLNLSDTQKEQVKAILEGRRDEHRATVEKSRAAHRALNEAVTAETFNEGLVRTRAAELAAVEADMSVARAHVFAQVFQILTPEQKAQVKEMQERRTERRSR
jgi:protein CpxP